MGSLFDGLMDRQTEGRKMWCPYTPPPYTHQQQLCCIQHIKSYPNVHFEDYLSKMSQEVIVAWGLYNTVNFFTMRHCFRYMSFVLHPLNAAVLANAILSIRLREMNKWLIVIDEDRCLGKCGWWMQYGCIHWNVRFHKHFSPSGE